MIQTIEDFLRAACVPLGCCGYQYIGMLWWGQCGDVCIARYQLCSPLYSQEDYFVIEDQTLVKGVKIARLAGGVAMRTLMDAVGGHGHFGGRD